ncbi:MAG: hypothetical protein M1318_01855 [Firmicutes bacterium]|nr:hypothetical protein [Bacillota bacterium]
MNQQSMFSTKKKSSRTLMTVGAAAVSLVTLAGCGTASAQAMKVKSTVVATAGLARGTATRRI